jgi:hypothetical protein
MWDGYFTLGGNEIGNSSRAIGYTRTAPCPIPWIRDRDCGGIAVATGDDEYFYTNISQAPWYDPDDPDTSGRFLGLYVVDINGLSDSTRTATITEKITDGAQVSGYRHTAREVRVRAMLTGAGEDALEYGMTWLRNALSPDACGVHGGDCGASDFQFFVSCPPPRGVVPELTPYTVRTNTIVNPRMENSTTGWEVVGGTNAQTQLPGGTRIDILGALATNNIFFRTSLGSTANSGQQWAGSMEVTNPSDYPAITLKLAALAYVGSSTLLTTADGPTVTIQPGETVRLTTSLLTTVGATSNVRLALKTAEAMPAGRRVFVRRALLEQTTADGGSYFDGTFPDVSENGAVIADYAWTGTANNSTSTASTRSWTTRPETNEEYQERILGLHRILHSVTTVSGPLVQQEMVSSDNTHYGYLVEFTVVAGVPFVYGATRDIPVPPTTPTVVQDVVYNLATHPSAELSSGTVLTGTNYSTNPSVETNATGWTHTSSVVLPADVTSARSTELAAVGVSSFRTLFLATNAGAAAGTIAGQQEVALPSAAVAGERYSINMWAAANIQTGTPVLGSLQIQAFWRAGGATLRTDTLGTIVGGSGVVTVQSIAPPVGATSVIVRATQTINSWAIGNAVRLYADALAVTKP